MIRNSNRLAGEKRYPNPILFLPHFVCVCVCVQKSEIQYNSRLVIQCICEMVSSMQSVRMRNSWERRTNLEWNSREKKVPTAKFSYGCSLSLCPFSRFSWFFLPVESFPNSIFLLHSLSVSVFHSNSCTLSRLFGARFGSLKATTARVRYLKSKHTFCTFHRIHASFFLQLLIFQSVFHLWSISFHHNRTRPLLNNTLAYAPQLVCTIMWVIVHTSLIWYTFLFNSCIYAKRFLGDFSLSLSLCVVQHFPLCNIHVASSALTQEHNHNFRSMLIRMNYVHCTSVHNINIYELNRIKRSIQQR